MRLSKRRNDPPSTMQIARRWVRMSRVCAIGLGGQFGSREAPMSQSAANALGKVLTIGLLTAIAGSPVMGADGAQTIPDFSGLWARVGMDPELMASGPKPLVNLRRPMDDPHVNGGGDPLPLV